MPQSVYFDASYRETVKLLEEVKHYLVNDEVYDRERVCDECKIVMNVEIMNIIARLSHILAWILAQKAVHNGEMTLEESLEKKLNISTAYIYSNLHHEVDERIPQRLRRFMNASRKLFERIERLERQMLTGGLSS